MLDPKMFRIFKNLGFFKIEKISSSIYVSHVDDFVIEALILDASGEIIGGPYADLISRIYTALTLYDAEKDKMVYCSPEIQERFLNKISKEAGLSRDLLSNLMR